MNISHVFDSVFSVQLSLALLHFVWQGALIAGGAVLAVWLLGQRSPQRRYRVYLTALVLMLLCLPVTLGVVVRWSPSREQPVADPSPEVSSAVDVETKGSLWRAPASGSSETVGGTEPIASPTEVTAPAPWLRREAWARWTAWSYLAGVAVMFARVCLAVLGGRRLRRTASSLSEPDLLEAIRTQMARFGLRIAPSVAWCDRVLVPVVIGMIKPAILLPASLATGLTPGQLQLVIAHELAHLYRWDHIAIVFQRVVEAVFFFHPAVWYISRRLSVEREWCCDELVLRAGSNAGEYAESLLRVAELTRPAATVAPLVAVAMTRGGRGSRALVQRLSRILGQPECSPVRLVNPWPLAVGLVVCLGAALICGSAGSIRALAQADSAEAAPLPNGNEPTAGAPDEQANKEGRSGASGRFITNVGQYNLHDGKLVIRVWEEDRKIRWSATQPAKVTKNGTIGPETVRPNDGMSKESPWFVFSSSSQVIWNYDGDKKMNVLTFGETGSFWKEVDLVPAWPILFQPDATVPKEVLDRLPPDLRSLGNAKVEGKGSTGAADEQKGGKARPKETVGLAVRINATDAKSKRPVKSLALIPSDYEESVRQPTWQSQYLKRFVDTPAEFRTERPWDATVLRIEADGYIPFLTRPIRRDEGELTLEVALTPDPGLAGKVLTPSGAPADGAVLRSAPIPTK